jgi:hypothetical protein
VGRLGRSWASSRPRSYDRRTLEISLCPVCQGPVPGERPPNGSWATTDCLHCGAQLVWVGVEQASGWQVLGSSDVEPAE